jgi:acyl transferase domain-containing protein
MCPLTLISFFRCAGRVSYLYNFSGPAVAIDTACSSSLVATAQAHGALALGICPSALAAGAMLMLSPATMAMYAVAGGQLEYDWSYIACTTGHLDLQLVAAMAMHAITGGHQE